MIVSDKDILKRIKEKSIQVEPFIRKNLQPSTIDITLDSKMRIFDNHSLIVIDPKDYKPATRIVDFKKQGWFVVHPGEFVLGNTVEKITIPDDLAAKLEGKSSLGRLGLIVHATAGYIDPGFSGNITLEISNISKLPIKLYAGMRIGQIAFYQMSSPVMTPYGSKKLRSKYQGQKEPTESRIGEDFK